jgi:hypothetical protein
MPGYKYPNIDSGATPIGNAGRAPDEKLFWEERGRKISSPWTRHFTPIGSADSRTRRFWEVEELKSKIEEIEDLKKSKIEEVEELKKSKIWSLETQPESATRIESRGLLTWECPSGTYGLVYRARPIKEVENYKDSKMTWRRRRKALICIRLGSL